MAASTPMSDFNKSSAKIAQLIAKICHGKKASYKYTEKKSGREVTAYKFECLLLGEKGVYMYGFLKGSQQQVNNAANKFKDGQVFKLSKISFGTWTYPTSISSPKAFRLNLEKTTCQQIAAGDALAQQIPLAPVPPRTVGETAKVTTNKSQDLLAVVKAATNRRTTKKDGIDIIDAVLIDDSKAETGELATVLVSVWGDQKVDLIEKNVGKPLAFFNLTIKMDAGNRIVNHYADALLLAAPDSEKTKHLLAEAATLTAATNTVQLSSEREWHPHESPGVSGPQPL